MTTIALADNGDGDGYADTNETVQMTLTFRNKSGRDVSDVVATLATSDSKIACISKAEVAVGSVANQGNGTTSTPFVFRVANVDRGGVGVNGTFKATFTVTLRAREFDVLTKPIAFDVDLDLDATGAGRRPGSARTSR